MAEQETMQPTERQEKLLSRRNVLKGLGIGALTVGTVLAMKYELSEELKHEKKVTQCEADAKAGHPHPTATPNPNGETPEGYDACGDPVYPIQGPIFGR